MAAAQAVRPAQGHNLLVTEAHAVEDMAQVLGPLSRVRQPPVRAARLPRHFVTASWLPLDLWACRPGSKTTQSLRTVSSFP